jgi:hypothetical protein
VNKELQGKYKFIVETYDNLKAFKIDIKTARYAPINRVIWAHAKIYVMSDMAITILALRTFLECELYQYTREIYVWPQD